ncbi:MAG: YdcF family protein, partial [Ilumatobacteraceae bacterium]
EANGASFLRSSTPLLIVTSDFHLRRARREFSRFFTDIRTVGADPDITDTTWGDIGITSFFPRVEALRNTTVYLREYVALLLSDLRN